MLTQQRKRFPDLTPPPGEPITPVEPLALLPGLDFSEADWLRILNAHSGRPSERRKAFGETIEMQVKRLGACVQDDDPCATSLELARRIAACPAAFRVAILEVIERFWSQEDILESFEQRMHRIGVEFCESNHQRLRAHEFRQRVVQGPSPDDG